MDAQIVWNFGYLAVEMLLGSSQLKNIGQESQVSWPRIKELTKDHPKLFELIDGCFRHSYNSRITLRKFFDLPLFAGDTRPCIAEHFVTASKIFNDKVFSTIKHSVNMKSRNMKSVSLQRK